MAAWAPLASRHEVDRAVGDIVRRLKSTHAAPDPGLLTGRAGIVLFFLYYARYTGSADEQAFAESQLGDLFDTLPDEISFTFCSGMSGVAWLLRHAAATGLVDAAADEALADIDAVLRERMLEEMRAGRFDYLHGALGVALYCLETAADTRSRAALAATVDALEQHALVDGDRICWRNPLLEEHADTRGGVSLGLSHGVPSVISLLQRFVDHDIEAGRATRLRDGALNYLLAQQRRGPGARYPDIVFDDRGPGSRLAWCYGDPGVAVSLWQAGRPTEALALLQAAASRRAPDDTGVTDISLCHGSAGLALIFGRAAMLTPHPSVGDAARFWLDDTLQGVTACTDPSLLNGLAGAGLALLALGGDQAPAWDRALLLS